MPNVLLMNPRFHICILIRETLGDQRAPVFGRIVDNQNLDRKSLGENRINAAQKEMAVTVAGNDYADCAQ